MKSRVAGLLTAPYVPKQTALANAEKIGVNRGLGLM